MTRYPRLLALTGLFALALALAACGEEAESLPPQPAEDPTVLTGAPWERIPADSLYGATPAENLTVTPVERKEDFADRHAKTVHRDLSGRKY